MIQMIRIVSETHIELRTKCKDLTLLQLNLPKGVIGVTGTMKYRMMHLLCQIYGIKYVHKL